MVPALVGKDDVITMLELVTYDGSLVMALSNTIGGRSPTTTPFNELCRPRHGGIFSFFFFLLIFRNLVVMHLALTATAFAAGVSSVSRLLQPLT